MNPTLAVFRRELKSYFGSILAYLVMASFLGLAAFFTFSEQYFDQNEAHMMPFFQILPFLFIFVAPAFAMRMWAEERRTGTIELLFTLPVTVPQAVIGKFLAGWAFFLVSLAMTLPVLFMVWYLGSPELGPIFTGYFGAALMAGAFLAVSMLFSVMTKNNVISLLLGVAACGLLVFIGHPPVLGALETVTPKALRSILETSSFLTHYDVMQRGVIEMRNLFFLIAMAVAFLFGSIVMLDDRKAN